MFNWKLFFKNLGLMVLSLLIGGVVMATDDKQDDFVPVEVMPEMTTTAQPEYPAEAKEAGVEGFVIVKVLVGRDGLVKKVEIADVSESGHGFEDAAAKAAHNCQFKPGMLGGEPVPAWVSYKVNFSLSDQK